MFQNVGILSATYKQIFYFPVIKHCFQVFYK